MPRLSSGTNPTGYRSDSACPPQRRHFFPITSVFSETLFLPSLSRSLHRSAKSPLLGTGCPSQSEAVRDLWRRPAKSQRGLSQESGSCCAGSQAGHRPPPDDEQTVTHALHPNMSVPRVWSVRSKCDIGGRSVYGVITIPRPSVSYLRHFDRAALLLRKNHQDGSSTIPIE